MPWLWQSGAGDETGDMSSTSGLASIRGFPMPVRFRIHPRNRGKPAHLADLFLPPLVRPLSSFATHST